MNKDQLENHIVKNCKTWSSINGVLTYHRISLPVLNADLDTKYARDHFYSKAPDNTKCYYWHTRFANGQGTSFNYIVKRMIKDAEKGIIELSTNTNAN